ncbi:MAG: Rv2231c family pyridoxal phosphate-dependent protein CobC, partial [Mycobacteriaceae bacterium]
GRPHWSLGTLQLEAIRACNEPAAVRQSQEQAKDLSIHREIMISDLQSCGVTVVGPATASFILIQVPCGEKLRNYLYNKGFLVRRCDTFMGLGPDYLRIAVRSAQQWKPLLAAIKEFIS